MKKIPIVSDKNIKSLKIKKILIRIIETHNFHKPNLIIVIGGDGFHASNIKKYKKKKKLLRH